MARWRTEDLEQLVSLSPSETTPLLLELARRQVARRRPSSLLDQLARDGFVQPSPLDLRVAHRLDGLALEAAAEFEALLLAPVAPLGSCSVLAPTSQDRTLTATRGTEVVSDPTNVLALECARRMRAEEIDVRLCTIHQVLRAQALPAKPGFTRHFRLFALAEAGRARAEDGFEVDAIARHVGVFDRLFDACEAIGHRFPQRRITLFSDARRAVLAERVRERLARELPHVELSRESFESKYYDGIRALFWTRAVTGDDVPIADTGVFDWMSKLTSNHRMRFVASGLGIHSSRSSSELSRDRDCSR